MNRKNKMLIYSFILLALVGCKGKSDNKNTIKKRDLAPKPLKELSKEIDSIMEYLGEIEKIKLGIDDEDKEDLGKEEDKTQEEGDKKEKEEEKPGLSQAGISSQNIDGSAASDGKPEDQVKKQEIRDEKVDSKWKDMDQSLEKLYSSWNEYGTKAIKKGATSENIEEIEDSLNKLTKGVEEREALTIYNYGSKVLKSLKPLYGAYRDEIGGEVSSLKHMVYQYYLNGVKNSTNTARLFIADSEDEINSIRLKLEDKKAEVEKVDQISFGFKNLSDSLDENSLRLLILKKDALIKNIKSLEN